MPATEHPDIATDIGVIVNETVAGIVVLAWCAVVIALCVGFS